MSRFGIPANWGHLNKLPLLQGLSLVLKTILLLFSIPDLILEALIHVMTNM